MVKLTEQELWAFNLLNSSATNTQAELNRMVAARDAFVKLLEIKYDATFDPSTGRLETKKKAQ